MSLQLDIYLNQLVQGAKPLAAGEQWFSELSDKAQVEILEKLAHFALQAGAGGADVDAAIARSGLRAGYTPCRVLVAHTKDNQKASSALRVALSKMSTLPADERSKSFLLLIALFWVADQRRRERNFDPVNHWWHRDLSDDRVVADILARNGAP